jgi:hypothetical protein
VRTNRPQGMVKKLSVPPESCYKQGVQFSCPTTCKKDSDHGL